MRRSIVLLISTALLALTACAAPMQDRDTAAQVERAQQDAQVPAGSTPAGGVTADIASPAPRTAPPMSRPLPPTRSRDDLVPAPSSAADGRGVTVSLGCQSNADCAIKNVGSCCGEHPACVNINSPTDPEGVQALCAEQGMVSSCGFPVISSCECVQGRCEGSNAAVME